MIIISLQSGVEAATLGTLQGLAIAGGLLSGVAALVVLLRGRGKK